MSAAMPRTITSSRVAKIAFFAALAAMTLIVIYTDELFIFNAKDPEWAHIAGFRWLLLPHALGSATALILGPFQISQTIRRNYTRLHRIMGRVYVGAVLFSSPIALYIGVTYEKPLVSYEQYFQAGGWFLSTLLAFLAAYNRNIPLHRQWMARSYAFTFIFVASRVTDAIPAFANLGERALATFLWSLVVAALIVPDLILNGADFFKSRRTSRA